MFPATEASHSAAEALPHGNKPSEPYKLPYETRPVFKLAGKKPPARRKMAAAPGISRTFEAPTVDEQLVLQFEDQMKSAPNPAASDRQGDEAESPVSRSSGFSEGERSRRRILRIHSKARLRKIEAASRTYELSMFPEQTSPVFGNASVNYPAAQWIPEELNAGLFRQSPSAFPRVIEQPSQAPALEVPIRPRPAGPRLEEEGVKTSRARSLIQIERPDTAPREIKQDVFDRLLYAQEGAATPPPGIVLPSPAGSADANPTRPLPADEPYYADIDPRIHWPQRHSEAWYAAKLEEIKARGGRKAWLGKAPLRLRQQLLAESTPFEETLPDKIRDNPAWLRMLKRLNGVEEDAVVPPAEKPMATRGRKPGPKKQQQQQVHVNGNGNGYGNGHGSGYGMFRG
ncbi:hypothetical protein QBC47DRAFT_396562 [Echria macrotheca]|uniref:Uncharacterized protein n=1 Tax=Echria macrotheca TaxID=438768 RepID=A0AAJ0FAY3_9PEZI|nr:hypothetical protein QBC47DRAFT_396562 [Echria macrotheca]